MADKREEGKFVQVRWCDNSLRRYDGKRAFVAIGSIVQINGQKVSDAERTELGAGLRNGDRVDMLFLYKHGKSRMWHGLVDLYGKVQQASPNSCGARDPNQLQ